MPEDQIKRDQQIAKIIAKTWADEDFKQRLIADPMTVLRGEDVCVPEGVTLKVVENTETLKHIVLPAKPTDVTGSERLDERQQGTVFCIACSYAD